MFRWLKAFIASREPSPATNAALVMRAATEARAQAEAELIDARERRSAAFRAAHDAIARNDDRDLGRAMMEARQATTDMLRAEAGR